jgi:hypothetical protein
VIGISARFVLLQTIAQPITSSSVLVATASLLACSGPARPSTPDAGGVQEVGNPCERAESGDLPDEALFEPAWLPNLPLESVSGVLTLYASTLSEGPSGLELYAGVCNHGEFPLCSAALQIELYDHENALIGVASGAVQSGRVYRFSQSPTPISCVEPGQTAMAALTLPAELSLDELGSLGHRFPAFRIDDAVFLPSVHVSDVRAFDAATGAAFRGTLTNVADTPIADPVVSVFPVSAVGRPLAAAVSTATLQLAPGGSWSFETSVVAEQGEDQFAFAAATFPPSP